MKTIMAGRFALLTTALLGCFFSYAQPFDSLRIINPGLSPSVIAHHRVEVVLFNQLSTEKSRFEFNNTTEISRFSSFYHVLQAGYGISKTNRLNIGGTFVFAHTRADNDEGRGALAVLGSGDSVAAVFHQPAALGLYVRGLPFRRLPELTVQAGVLFPATNDLTTRAYSGYDRTLAQLQFSFYQQFSPLFYLFATAETDLLFSNSNRKQTTLLVPLSLYPVIRLGHDSKAYLYGNLSYTAQYNKVSPGFLKSTGHRMLYGIGAQYYFTSAFSLYAQFQLPASVKTNSTTTTVLKNGAYRLALGGRFVI